MKFIETKREELRRERIALNEQEWPELVQLLKGIGDKFVSRNLESTQGCKTMYWDGEWIRDNNRNKTPTITLAELKAKYFEEEQLPVFNGVPTDKEWAVGPCENEEIAKQVLGIGHNAGFKWASGDSFLSLTFWSLLKSETCYHLIKGAYGDDEFYQNQGARIIPAADFIAANQHLLQGQREPKPGDWGYFWDYESDEYAIFGQLKEIENGKFHTVDEVMNYFSHTIPPHIQELMKTPEYEVVYSFGESEGEIVVEKEIEPGLYAGTRGGVNVVLKRVGR